MKKKIGRWTNKQAQLFMLICWVSGVVLGGALMYIMVGMQ